MRLGIIDVGTNSTHVVIGTVEHSGRFRVLARQRELTRLGDRGLTSGALTTAAMRRATTVLRRYARLLKRARVDHVEAVATSAVREASNGAAFVRRVRRRLRLPLRIISGREEARLIAQGVWSRYRFRRTALIVSIGGGSAQVIQGDGMHPGYLASVPLGCARLARRFIRHDPPRSTEVDALDRHVRRSWAPVMRAVRRRRWRLALGSSATIEQVMKAASLRAHARHRGGARRRLSISQGALRRLVVWLSTSTTSQRRQLPGLDPAREDLALTSAVTLLAWMEGCGIVALQYAPGSLREGLAMEHSRALAHVPVDETTRPR